LPAALDGRYNNQTIPTRQAKNNRDSDARIHVSVEDDGVGFNPAKIAPTPLTKAGFGLFSCRELLEQLGGHLEIESESGCGSKITLVVPMIPKATPCPPESNVLTISPSSHTTYYAHNCAPNCSPQTAHAPFSHPHHQPPLPPQVPRPPLKAQFHYNLLLWQYPVYTPTNKTPALNVTLTSNPNPPSLPRPISKNEPPTSDIFTADVLRAVQSTNFSPDNPGNS